MLPRFFRLIGSDRFLAPAEVEHAAGTHPLVSAGWDVYRQHFGGFTGAAIDPLFHRLSHPAERSGTLRLEPGASVIVVGTGPSLHANLEGLKRVRGRVRLFTSPRGAEVLVPYGIVPDLVLVEHQTALDAHHSARHLDDATHEVLPACPLIAADWRTPAALLRGVRQEAMFVPAALPTWGLWTATAAAMAIESGASRVALVGVDLGTTGGPDAMHLPLIAVLALLARLAPVVALDCGAAGATKRGWIKASIDEAAGAPVTGPLDVGAFPAPARSARVDEARAALDAHAGIVGQARALLQLAAEARNGRSGLGSRLAAGTAAMMAWREDAGIRVFAQESLGLSFLPRLWRSGVNPSLGEALWRPLMLATHELVRQADALSLEVRQERAA